ncbi:hypothetical protein PvtlMGM1_2077 [Prevotella sp. MGM1]|jgi:hypothetical protein|nr:hypothetical protein PvtlMGM1_2077 [Prevotella sp. MGM1]
MIPAIHKRNLTGSFTENHIPIGTAGSEITVEKHRPASMGSVKRLLPVKRQGTFEIYPVSGKRVIGTLHVATVEQYAPCPIERVHIQPAYKPDIAGHHTVTMTVSHMSLCYGRGPLLASERRKKMKIEINITEIAHGKVAHPQSVTMKIEHRKITDRALCLASLRG